MGFAPPPYVPPAALQDVGGSAVDPFVIVISGQSNAVGADVTGDKTIRSGIYTLDSITAPTTIIPAQIGDGSLKNGAGCSISNPLSCVNNIGLQFANALRDSGVLPANRPIILAINAINGVSIERRVGQGAQSDYFAYLAASLNVITSKYPGAKVNHLIWAQGEGDQNSGLYNSKDLYRAAFKTLLTQWRGLPQWTPYTTVSVQELATFANNPLPMRNDAIRTFANGLFDPCVTMVSSTGLSESAYAPGPHFDGPSIDILGRRHLAAWRAGSLRRGYSDSIQNYAGGGSAIKNVITVTSNTTLNYDDFRAGAVVNWSGGTLTLPNPTFAPDSPEIQLNVSGTQTLTSTNVGIMTPNAASTPLTVTVPNGRWRLSVAGGYWQLARVDIATGGRLTNPTAYTAGASATLNNFNVLDSYAYVNGNTITLPAVVSGIFGAKITFFGAPGGTSSTINAAGGSSTIVLPGGTTASSYTVAAGRLARFELIGGFWVVTTN